MQSTKFINYREVLEMYPNEDTAESLGTELGMVMRYYNEGDDHHNRNFDPYSREEFGDLLTFLKDFREMVDEMSHEKEVSLIIQNENLKLNLDPFIEFMEATSPLDCMMTIRAIKDRMTNYLHDRNVVLYKETMATMERIELFFVNLLIDATDGN